MSKNKNLALGVLSFVPLIGLFLTYFVGLHTLFSNNTSANSFYNTVGQIQKIKLITFVLSLLTAAYFSIDVLKRGNWNVTKKLFWILGLFILSIIAQPIYWHQNYWSRR